MKKPIYKNEGRKDKVYFVPKTIFLPELPEPTYRKVCFSHSNKFSFSMKSFLLTLAWLHLVITSCNTRSLHNLAFLCIPYSINLNNFVESGIVFSFRYSIYLAPNKCISSCELDHILFLFYFSSFSLIDNYGETKPAFPKSISSGICQHYKENKRDEC